MKAKVYDLSAYLEEKRSTIKLGEDEYEISDGFNDLLKIDALANSREDMGNADFVREFLTVALGKDAAEKLIAKNYKTKIYMQIIESIQDSLTGGEEQEGASSEKPELV